MNLSQVWFLFVAVYQHIDSNNHIADNNFVVLEQLKSQIVKNKQAVIDDVNNIYKFGLKDFAKYEEQKLQDLQQELVHRAKEYNTKNQTYIQSLHNDIKATTITHAASIIKHVANIQNIDHELPKYLIEAKHDDI